jgi:hypothetical protein
MADTRKLAAILAADVADTASSPVRRGADSGEAARASQRSDRPFLQLYSSAYAKSAQRLSRGRLRGRPAKPPRCRMVTSDGSHSEPRLRASLLSLLTGSFGAKHRTDRTPRSGRPGTVLDGLVEPSGGEPMPKFPRSRWNPAHDRRF